MRCKCDTNMQIDWIWVGRYESNSCVTCPVGRSAIYRQPALIYRRDERIRAQFLEDDQLVNLMRAMNNWISHERPRLMAWNQGAAIFTGGIRVKLKEEEATEQAEAETEEEEEEEEERFNQTWWKYSWVKLRQLEPRSRGIHARTSPASSANVVVGGAAAADDVVISVLIIFLLLLALLKRRAHGHGDRRATAGGQQPKGSSQGAVARGR